MQGYVRLKQLEARNLPEVSLNNSKPRHTYSQNECNISDEFHVVENQDFVD